MNAKLVTAALLTVILSACGGGGGGDNAPPAPPAAPIAAIAPMADIELGAATKFDGRSSTVAASRTATYQWEMSKRPGGSSAVLTEGATATPGFVPDVSGTYEVRLLVSDGAAQSVAATALLNVRVPRQPNLWQALPASVPVAGNYVYIEGTAGDYISGGARYLYTEKDSVLKFLPSTNQVSIRVQGDQDWDGDFALPEAKKRVEAGIYKNLTRYPFHVKADGGLDWGGEGRGCNMLTGWIAIDYAHYTGDRLDMLDMRFEQHCEGGASALHGQVHWVAADKSMAPGPAAIPADLWQPLAGTTPASGTYVFLTSSLGDYIGGGKTYTYTPASAPDLRIDVSGNSLRVNVGGWTGTFIGMNNLAQMTEGYYPGLLRYPFHNPVKGGMDWSGNGRGCNQLSGWLAIDKMTFVTGNLTYLDARFEQHCEMGASALRGKIHYER